MTNATRGGARDRLLDAAHGHGDGELELSPPPPGRRRNGALPTFQIPEGVETVTVGASNNSLTERVGLGSAGGLVLVRPDGYIGLIARPTDADAATNYFARLMR